jgi:hypothetical protein
MKTINYLFLLHILLLSLGLGACSENDNIVENPNGNEGKNNSNSQVAEFDLVVSSLTSNSNINIIMTSKEGYYLYNNDSIDFHSSSYNSSLEFNNGNKVHSYHVRAASLEHLFIDIEGDIENIKLNLKDNSIVKWFGFSIKNTTQKIDMDINLSGIKDSLQMLTINLDKNCKYILDVSDFKRLERLRIAGEEITELNAKNCLSLKGIELLVGAEFGYHYLLSLTSIDLSNCEKLTGNWNWAFLGYLPSLETLNLSGCKNLTSIDDYYHYPSKLPLITLNLKDCISLKSLSYTDGRLNSLNLQGCLSLGSLKCDRNELTSLNIDDCIKLGFLQCSSNKLTSLEIPNSDNLKGVNCSFNELTHLDIDKCSNVTELYCNENKLETEALNNLFKNLNSLANTWKYIDIKNNPGESTCDKDIAERKEWIFR